MDLSMLRLGVYDKNNVEKDQFLCENIVPLQHLRTGVRCIPLRGTTSAVIEACHLLVRIELNDYISVSNQPIAIIEELARLRDENKKLKAQLDSTPSSTPSEKQMDVSEAPEEGKELVTPITPTSQRPKSPFSGLQTPISRSARLARSDSIYTPVTPSTPFDDFEPVQTPLSDLTKEELEMRTRKLEDQMDEMLTLFKTVNDNLYRDSVYTPVGSTKITEVPVDNKWNAVLPLCRDPLSRAMISRLARVNVSLNILANATEQKQIDQQVEQSMDDITLVIDAILANESKLDEKKSKYSSFKKRSSVKSIKKQNSTVNPAMLKKV
jgi:hypothetical protein